MSQVRVPLVASRCRVVWSSRRLLVCSVDRPRFSRMAAHAGSKRRFDANEREMGDAKEHDLSGQKARGDSVDETSLEEWDKYVLGKLPETVAGAGHAGLARKSPALDFEVIATWGRARACRMTTRHATCYTPMFMPVGTKGSVKGLAACQLEKFGFQMILGNTYHLEDDPTSKVVEKLGGLHEFTGWKRAMLTDSGGFQMVSLLHLAEITEEGVSFQSPKDRSLMMLTPEESIRVQNRLGADVMMALDDVVPATAMSRERFIEATHRTTRWIDRCISAHSRPNDQSLFAIVQGGLSRELRDISLKGLVERDLPGYAVGGLAGGEDKQAFWRVVAYCAPRLPADRPRYVMGIGHPIDIVVCSALGADMYDSVFPSRTARFGTALVSSGEVKFRREAHKHDESPLDPECDCMVCKKYTKSFMYFMAAKDISSATSLVTYHNMHYMARLGRDMRASIIDGTFPDWVRNFTHKLYGGPDKVEAWVRDALAVAGIEV